MKECTNRKKINKIVEETRDLLFTKFGNIVFEEIPHKYTIDNVEYTPVSTIIKKYENEFDEDTVSKNYAKKNGLKQEDVLKEWKWTNKMATIMGTRAHAFGESYTNLMCGHKELITEQNLPQLVEEENWLVPTFPQEFAVKKFYDELHENLYPVGAEFKLSTQYMEGTLPICGTADLLFYYCDPSGKNSGFVIMDWKTNLSLTNEYVRKNDKMMLPPLSDWYDEALSHYTLQFNLYQKMMESVGLKIIARRLVHIKRDGNYEIHNIPLLDENIINHVLTTD